MRWMSIAFPLVLLMDCVMFVNFLFWQQDAYLDLRQRQLDLQVNYAADAAAHDLLEMGTHIDTDYADWGRMSVEPELALNTYEAVLIRNFGWGDSKANRESLEAYSVPFFIVAAYDGYYSYSKQKNLSTLDVNGNNIGCITYDNIWTPKIPYATYNNMGYEQNPSTGKYEFNNSDSYRLYNLGDKYYTLVTGNSVTAEVPLRKDRYNYTYLNPRTKLVETRSRSDDEERKQVIAETLTDACNSALYNGMYGDSDRQFYIPAEFTQWADNNAITNVSILTYVIDPLVTSTEEAINISTFAISGSKIDEPIYCILYTDNSGNLLYTYERNRDKVSARGLKITAIVTSPKEAAMRGYHYDTTYLKVN